MRLAVLDALHERVAPVVVLAVGFLCIGVPVARATGMSAPDRVVLDFVLWWSWLFGTLLAMWLGSRCIAGPLADRTALWELGGPVRPGVWGARRLGGAALVAGSAHLLVLAVGLGLAGPPPGALAFAGVSSLEVLVLTALSAALGTVFRPLPALALTAALWVAGHLAGMWLDLMTESDRAVFAGSLLAVIPDLDLLDVHGTVVRGGVPALPQLAAALGWALAWVGVAIGAMVTVLERRDLG
ncbi:MAG: hypothetical protein R3F61_10260 [Myxococcota bacterium]